jgi:hypothetical protein
MALVSSALFTVVSVLKKTVVAVIDAIDRNRYSFFMG